MVDNSQYQGLLDNPLFDVEHALSLYANSYCIIPAEYIYDKSVLDSMIDVIKKCHIYIIGLQPKIDYLGATQDKNKVFLTFSILGKDYTIENTLPNGIKISQGNELFFTNEQGIRYKPDLTLIQRHLSQESNAVTFEVKYIGQAYGKEGSRNAVDRLLKHETLQEISLKGIPNGYQLYLLLLEIHPNNKLITAFKPNAKNKDEDSSRIMAGLEKLYNTTLQERISLYEAALIRYFSPQYNKEFKNSFPSTNLKILQDCYEKDFSAVVAEIYFDNLPFKLFSEVVKASEYHIASFNLHTEDDRKLFFGILKDSIS
ncbi:TPA: hypothetical protein I8Y81_000138 [Legionella pneumophila]|nr:hypothetical protein [Legionella pneumophila]HBC0467814.1 hypothetical protein [Legionella pneumophila]